MAWSKEEMQNFIRTMYPGAMDALECGRWCFAMMPSLSGSQSTSRPANPKDVGEVAQIGGVLWLNLTTGASAIWVSNIGTVYPATTYVGISADPVADIAALKAVAVVDREDKQRRLVESIGEDWRFDATSTLTGDDYKVIEPTVGTGRWILIEESVYFTNVKVVAKNGKTVAQGGTGSFDKPYNTLTEGCAALTAGGTLIVYEGTYTEAASLSPVSGTRIKGIGTVSVTVAGAPVFSIAASRTVYLEDITVTGPNNFDAISVVTGGGGAATALTLTWCYVTSLGTGHGIANLGKGNVTLDNSLVAAGGTGNGVNLAGATSNLASKYSAISGTAAINQASTSTVAFIGPMPLNCTFATPANVTQNPATGFTKTVYVAKNGTVAAAGADGTPERPYLTVTQACLALSSGGTVMIAEGTYTEPGSISPANNTTIKALGGPVTITCAAAVFTIAANRTLNLWGNLTVLGPNNLNAVELADGATTKVYLYDGASIASVGTGHGCALAGQGIVVNNRGTIAAGATGNGVELFNAGGSSYVGIHSVVTAIGGKPINKPAGADCIFYGCPAPEGCTLTAGGGAVTVYESPMIPSKAWGAMPDATKVPYGTVKVCTDFPDATGTSLMSDGTKWVVPAFAPKTEYSHGDAPEAITVALLLANDTFRITAMSVPRIYTVDTAANIVTGMHTLCNVGTTLDFIVYNGSAVTGTVAVGAGGTLVGSGSVLAGCCARFKLKITNVGAPAYDLIRTAADVSSAAIVALAAGKTIVYGNAVIDPAAATDVVATGLAAIANYQVTLEDAPLLAEVMFLTATAAAGNLTTSAWTCTAAGDTNPKIGVGKAGVGTKYRWWAIGTA